MKMNKKALIEKYMNGQCTGSEKDEVERLLKINDEETISHLDQAASLLDKSTTIVNADLEKIWKNVDTSSEETPSKSIFITPLKIAAAILMMVASSYVLFSFFEEEVKKEETVSAVTVVKHTNRGENLTVRLPDGTMVRLNSSSTISYSQNLILADQRVVELQGEAFFEVKRDEYRPFIVKTRGVNTTVLGTSFNVNARKNDVVKVAVVTGKVSVEQGQEKVVLTPGDMAIVDEKVGKTTYDFDEEVGWKNGVLVLRANEFMEVIDDIEQWYGVDIEVQGKIGEQGINVKYTNESLEEVLEGLSFAAHFNYVINDKRVKLIVK